MISKLASCLSGLFPLWSVRPFVAPPLGSLLQGLCAHRFEACHLQPLSLMTLLFTAHCCQIF